MLFSKKKTTSEVSTQTDVEDEVEEDDLDYAKLFKTNEPTNIVFNKTNLLSYLAGALMVFTFYS